MTNSTLRRVFTASAFLALVMAVTFGVWRLSYDSALDQLESRGRADLQLASDRLTGQLGRYRGLAAELSDHPAVVGVLEGGSAAAARDVLRAAADRSGALDIIVLDRRGKELTSADGRPWNRAHTELSYFDRAMDGAMGTEHLVTGEYGREGLRAFIFAAPVFAAEGPVEGAVVFVVDVGAIEAGWRGAQPAVFFTDELGVVFVSSRSELIFRRRGTGNETAVQALYGDTRLRPFTDVVADLRDGHRIWTVDGGRYLPQQALYLTQSLPVIGMRGEAMIDVAPARRIAALQAAVAGALCLAFAAMLFLATERRRTLAGINARLEARVARRTKALVSANEALRGEVAERREAETALRRAQEELVQAGKLSALGQMSAGISHELNQPLMAIGSFASNAERFIERGDTQSAAKNLTRISEMSRRMGRIISNLRAFARQESEPVGAVDLGAAVSAALEIVEGRLEMAEVTLDWVPPAQIVLVRAGEVRLTQVIVNLLGNAIDAMEGGDDRRVEISLDLQTEGSVALTVRDNGPGIVDPDRIFDPFFSTKEVGTGLGLSISYGLIQSFGGALKGRNHPGGGAVFTVELPLAAPREDVA